jgi:hypothetical protein
MRHEIYSGTMQIDEDTRILESHCVSVDGESVEKEGAQSFLSFRLDNSVESQLNASSSQSGVQPKDPKSSIFGQRVIEGPDRLSHRSLKKIVFIPLKIGPQSKTEENITVVYFSGSVLPGTRHDCPEEGSAYLFHGRLSFDDMAQILESYLGNQKPYLMTFIIAVIIYFMVAGVGIL